MKKKALDTILVVDDSSSNRSFLRAVLEEDGFRVMEAASGEECISIAKNVIPVLILLDVVMVGMNGFETLAILKEDINTRDIAVIMSTSIDDQEARLLAFDYGAVDYVNKSSNVAELRARCRVHVRLAIAKEEILESRTNSLKQLSEAQKAMFVKPEEYPDAKFSVYYQSLNEAGGDSYDVVPVSEGVFFYLIADVAGHDVGTSYVAPALKVLLRQCATPVYTVSESVSYFHRMLTKTVLKDNYLTAFALKINRKANKAVFLAAGHPPAIYVPKEGPVCLAECENPFIGMINENTFVDKSINVNPGDKFILYTDGLVEANGKNWIDAVCDLIPIVESLRLKDKESMLSAILDATKAREHDDDVAMLIVEV